MRQPAHRLYNGESLYISGVVGVAGARGDRHVPLAVGRKGESTWPPRSWEGAGAEVIHLSLRIDPSGQLSPKTRPCCLPTIC
ncbi:hypothetical protein CKAN_02775600 [Cinnamomum micranthum f. kanehirae]|uniref:Uncharacterized protein n=1 Tax=Cinnamomum micranthum f. kanehirae TaxID=337451 RepID=A0A3S3PV25_9MAGN|nr:hypothetical protein CKAN_02775600 [Cinnamomum micranthum f. kanehirae]